MHITFSVVAVTNNLHWRSTTDLRCQNRHQAGVHAIDTRAMDLGELKIMSTKTISTSTNTNTNMSTTTVLVPNQA